MLNLSYRIMEFHSLGSRINFTQVPVFPVELQEGAMQTQWKHMLEATGRILFTMLRSYTILGSTSLHLLFYQRNSVFWTSRWVCRFVVMQKSYFLIFLLSQIGMNDFTLVPYLLTVSSPVNWWAFSTSPEQPDPRIRCSPYPPRAVLSVTRFETLFSIIQIEKEEL